METLTYWTDCPEVEVIFKFDDKVYGVVINGTIHKCIIEGPYELELYKEYIDRYRLKKIYE
jgi:hypothetical protein